MSDTNEFFLVTAPKGKTCPMAMSRDKIDDTTPVRVPNDTYYRSRIAEGSLVIVPPPAPVSEKKSGRSR